MFFITVARKIYTTFPDVAVLRRHPDPKMDLLDKMIEQLSFLGVQIDGKIKLVDIQIRQDGQVFR